MLKHLYKTALIAFFGVLSFQESFAQCPSRILPIMGDTVCSNSTDAYLKISNTKVGDIFQAFLGAVAISSPIVSSGIDVLINVKVSSLQIGKNTVVVKHTVTGCEAISFSNNPVIVVNQQPRTDQRVVSKPYCPGAAASIIIYGTRPGEIYEPNLSAMAIGAPVKSVTDTVLLNIATNMLQSGLNEIYFRASIDGCAMVQLENKATLVQIPAPDIFFSVSGDVVCKESPSAKITIKGSSPNIQYQMYRGTEKFMDSFYGDAGVNTTVKNIPTSLLLVGKNLIKVEAMVKTSCQTLVLADNAEIIVNATPDVPTQKIVGDTVFITDKFAVIKVYNTFAGQTISLKGPLQDTVFSSSGKLVEIKIPIGEPNGLAVGIHKIILHTQIAGCVNINISDTAWVLVKPNPSTSVEAHSAVSNFAVYPNPFSSEITITSKLKGQLKMQITDAIGNIVHQESISNAQDLKLNPDLKSGLYFLQMESEGSRETVKLIKQ